MKIPWRDDVKLRKFVGADGLRPVAIARSAFKVMDAFRKRFARKSL